MDTDARVDLYGVGFPRSDDCAERPKLNPSVLEINSRNYSECTQVGFDEKSVLFRRERHLIISIPYVRSVRDDIAQVFEFHPALFHRLLKVGRSRISCDRYQFRIARKRLEKHCRNRFDAKTHRRELT